jgi:hypothetical protein
MVIENAMELKRRWSNLQVKLTGAQASGMWSWCAGRKEYIVAGPPGLDLGIPVGTPTPTATQLNIFLSEIKPRLEGVDPMRVKSHARMQAAVKDVELGVKRMMLANSMPADKWRWMQKSFIWLRRRFPSQLYCHQLQTLYHRTTVLPYHRT